MDFGGDHLWCHLREPYGLRFHRIFLLGRCRAATSPIQSAPCEHLPAV